MIFDTIKLLTEQPEKLVKFILISTKATLGYILTSKLYEQFIGPYELINITNYTEIYEYVTTGRLLISVLLFLLCNYILFNPLTMFTWLLLGLLVWIYKKVIIIILWPLKFLPSKSKSVNTQGNFFRELLIRLEYIQANEDVKVVRAGKKIDEFYRIAKLLSNKNARKSYNAFKFSLADDIWHTFVIFSILYYAILLPYFHSMLLTVIIIISYIIIPLLHEFVKQFAKFIEQNSDRIIHDIKTLRLGEHIKKALYKHSVLVFEPESYRKAGYDFSIGIDNDKYLIKFRYKYGYEQISLYPIESAIETAMQENSKILIISNAILSKKAENLININPHIISFLNFQSKKDLDKKLFDFFEDHYSSGNPSSIVSNP